MPSKKKASKKAGSSSVPARRDRNVPSSKKVGGDVPAWLAEHAGEADKSTGDLAEHRVLPRLKVVQSMTDADLKREFGEGSIIIAPGGIKVVDYEEEETVDIVPVIFFTEFCKWSDLNDTQTNTIVERSFDPSSELAKRARNENLREEAYGESGFKYKYVEHLNFGCFFYSEEHPLYGIPFVMGFSRGEFGTGKRLINSILLRRIGQATAPLWSQVWRISSGFRDETHQWYGIDFSNPENPYIEEHEVEFFKSHHEILQRELDESRIVVDLSDGDDVDIPASTEM